jgi:hypothetical protein
MPAGRSAHFLVDLIASQIDTSPGQKCACVGQHGGSGQYVFLGPTAATTGAATTPAACSVSLATATSAVITWYRAPMDQLTGHFQHDITISRARSSPPTFDW